MKNTFKQFIYFGIFFSILNACQSKEEKKTLYQETSNKNIANNEYVGKWLLINKENSNYYHCTDADRFVEINSNIIHDHTPMEDSNFNIDHTKIQGNKIFFYVDKQENSYYILDWVDKEKGIISYQFNDYAPTLFINENKIKTIKNKACQQKKKSCEINNASKEYKFMIEAAQFSNDKEQKNLTSAWIIVTNKRNNKKQEIYFEPNSWIEYSDLPCDKFIINDFNFDGLEDFAFVWDNGGNAGQLYEYYIQDKNGSFAPIDSFPLQHGVLAEDINSKDKTITTKKPVGCCNINITQYKYNSDGTWKTTSKQEKINE